MNLRVRFQPIVDVLNQTVLGYESTLLGPNGENAPMLFEAAKTIDEILTIDRRAVESSLQLGLSLLQEGQLLFVNLHPETIVSGLEFLFDLPITKNVVLEVTEQAVLTDCSKNDFIALQECGLKFAIDDYGKKNSNLDRLCLDWFQPTYLKLDREFAAKVSNKKVLSVIKHTTSLCSELGISLIVEGIENDLQRHRLRDIGVRYMQGYHIGMPKEVVDPSFSDFRKMNLV